ncbi:kinase-like domain-containing protein [Chaetomium tenue]|uniref:Kinase-like domain-containing protein n=1 Tax=Chaetomium tenue TaxID=1854479 RepID=A0ACB7PP61_9PEZI|nr:kinase-like domain-containing protein [Chaetomium globosum]
MDTFRFSPAPKRDSGRYGPRARANRELCYISVARFTGDAIVKMKQINDRAKEGLDNYTIISPIGQGGFGLVSLVRRKQNGRVYALKQIHKKGTMEFRLAMERMCTERCALVDADSEWIVKLYTAFQDKTNFYFLFEYLPGGDLEALLSRKIRFHDRTAAFYLAEIVLALETVHNLGFIHRDLKPENVLLDRQGHVKLADFGLSKSRHKTIIFGRYGYHLVRDSAWDCILDKSKEALSDQDSANYVKEVVGTPQYMAPELFKDQEYSFESD